MLKGKVILITGAAGGIGSAAARLAAEYGAIVIANYHTAGDKAASLLKEIKKTSPESIAIKADISRKTEANKMIKEILVNFKKIDAVVNNAGASIAYKQFSEIEWKDFQKQLDTTLLGSLNVIKGALPAMTGAKSGKIVNVLSSVTLGAPPAKPIDYISAKYALLGFSKALAVELGPYGITVNCVSPGLVDTNMTKAIPQKARELTAYQTPLKRLAEPIDAASAIIFLCSGLSDYITGANIPVCGGNVM